MRRAISFSRYVNITGKRTSFPSEFRSTLPSTAGDFLASAWPYPNRTQNVEKNEYKYMTFNVLHFCVSIDDFIATYIPGPTVYILTSVPCVSTNSS